MRSAEVYGDEGEPSRFEKWCESKLHINVMAAVSFIATLLGVVLETKRDDVYAQFYKNGAPLSEPYTAFSSELKEKTDAVFIGNGTLRLKEEIPEACIEEMPMPTARTAAFLSFDKVASETYPSPLYLREAEVTLCRK